MRVLQQLSEVIHEKREAILADWRARVLEIPAATRLTMPALNDHMPRFLDELTEVLRRSEHGEPPAAASPYVHGGQRFADGFDIEQVVAEYHILRCAVLDVAEASGMAVRGEAQRAFNGAIDKAIAASVKTYADCQAAEAQRRREEYLAFVAHDLRTPIHAITLATRMLELRWPHGGPDEATERVRRTLLRNTEHLQSLVDAVLEENTHILTEIGIRLERRHFELWPVAEGVLQDLHPIATQKKARLVNEVPDALSVQADATVLRRVLQNLVANAIEYAPGGSVTVGARDEGPGKPVECWVRDDGDGIPPERIAKVFDAMETDPEREGKGLGLAIVKTFIEAHGGRVWVESAPHEGATFHFTLPRRQP